MLPAEIMSLSGALLLGVAALLVVREQKSLPFQSSSLFLYAAAPYLQHFKTKALTHGISRFSYFQSALD
jgi:hypothetical protein